MTTRDLDRWFQSVLNPGAFSAADPSLNGIQIDNDGADVTRVAFAVDACLETVERALEAGAGMLFVHHGLYWGKSVAVTGRHYRILKRALEGNLALYASHLPLDAHPECGNNAGLAARLSLESLEPFGVWHGAALGRITSYNVCYTKLLRGRHLCNPELHLLAYNILFAGHISSSMNL